MRLHGCGEARQHAGMNEPPPKPTPERLPAWRAAALAYRAKRQAGFYDDEAHRAAVAALQAVWPLPWKEASHEAIRAVCYAAREHREWFWRGVGRN